MRKDTSGLALIQTSLYSGSDMCSCTACLFLGSKFDGSYHSKAFALTWYRALTWYCSPARPFAALDVPLRVTGQQGGPSPACRHLSRAPNACVGISSQESTKLEHGTKLGRPLCYMYILIWFIHMHVKHLWPSPRVDESRIVVGVPAAAARISL